MASQNPRHSSEGWNPAINSQTSQLLVRFSRVKGSGTFSLDEFCALTGLSSVHSVKVLQLGEKQGLILCLTSGFYLLKPASKRQNNAWADWRPPLAKVQAFLDLIPAHRFTSPSALIAKSGLPATIVTRYLRILLFTGNVKCKSRGLYRKLDSQITTIPSWHQVVAQDTVPAKSITSTVSTPSPKVHPQELP